MFEGSKIDFSSFLYLPINIPFWPSALWPAGSMALNKGRLKRFFYFQTAF